ncbi:hypothetical protein SCHPADRAFT_818431 [Schizopora paradoxa]|uniref:Methyltransferase domain-containing protein n=1 Tax=Schizopora paradoxa TaxID=27342 RepID=A0A0H2S4U1_9AGAM|nr:hypothetical protein SCHPADRAFT_818431 [Schizopora paradoxa]
MVDLQLSPEDISFLSAQTGLDDVVELKSHILQVQSEALDVHPFPCIRRFDFIRNQISSLPCYEIFIQRAKERENSIFIDVGCCCGTDIRKVVADGVSAKNIVGTDLRPEFWDIGHRLYRSTPESFPVRFAAGDILDPSFLSLRDVVYEDETSENSDAELSVHNLTSLTPLLGRVSFIHTAALFHLFSEEDQLLVAKRFASLLSPVPGSMIFGWHAGRVVKGFRSEAKPAGPGMLGNNMFCHSPESWKEMWSQQVFRPGTVSVEATLIEKVRDVELVVQSTATPQYLVWSVTRL